MPSMGNAMRQDRYGWIELEWNQVYHNATASSSQSYIEAILGGGTQASLEQIPACGWIRTDDGGRPVHGSAPCPAFAPYHSREVYDNSGTWTVRFWLAPNRITGKAQFEDITTWNNKCAGATLTVPGMSPIPPPPPGVPDPLPTKLFIWSKSGVHYYNNENATARDHMTRVHFSGVVDAIDRTRPTGVMGWAGERYSYLNSLKVGTQGYGAGLGAWHPMLGFSPYGPASSAMSTFSHLPHFTPMRNGPEATGPLNNRSNSDSVLTTPYSWNYTTTAAATYDDVEDSTYFVNPLHIADKDAVPRALHHTQGVFGRAFLVISYEPSSHWWQSVTVMVSRYRRLVGSCEQNRW